MPANLTKLTKLTPTRIATALALVFPLLASAQSYEYHKLTAGLKTADVVIVPLTPTTPVVAPATATLGSTALNFASTAVGQTSAASSVTMTNSGGVALAVTSATVTGPFLAATNCTSALAAGSSCTTNVSFQPIAAGAATGALSLVTALGTQSVPLTGTGLQAHAGLSTATLALGSVAVGQSATSASVTLSNTGNLALTGIAASVPAGYAVTSNNCSATLAAGANCTFQVTFTPTAAASYPGNLVLTSSDMTQNIALSGTGQQPVANLSTTNLALGSVVVGQTATSATVTLSNSGNIELTGLTLTPSTAYTLTGSTCATTLAAGANCTFSVLFTPVAVQSYPGTVSMTATNAASQSVVLSGTGTAVTDSSFSGVAFLSHMNGTNGATSFVDQKGHVMSVAAGAPVTSTAISKFGGSSMYHPAGAYIKSAAADTAFDITAGNFTVETWLYLTSYNSAGSNGLNLATNIAGVGGSGWNFGVNGVGGATQLSLVTINAGAYKDQAYSTSFTSLPLNAWHHLAVSFDNSTKLYSFYVDGTRYGTATSAGSVAAGGPLAIGAYTQNLGYPSYYWTGYIDDMRVTKGTARYSGASITVPTAAFADQ